MCEYINHHETPYLFTFPPTCLPSLGDIFEGRIGSVFGEFVAFISSTPGAPLHPITRLGTDGRLVYLSCTEGGSGSL